ncbi:hypothetical protein [Futiania mangrovi]|uniref:DUF11 domain-containing protein n=1 Tax=Futiania mangrovi TaxID=2959716 RepID=A0A9J6PCF2_9PROT|nr:hypothetical protein [Futiania mangrovii]MCP1335942.1 hypothetical protein [Futiania mangrovii]
MKLAGNIGALMARAARAMARDFASRAPAGTHAKAPARACPARARLSRLLPVLACILPIALPAWTAAAPALPGTRVENTARVDFAIRGEAQSQASNTVTFTVVPPRAAARMTLMRHNPAGTPVTLVNSSYATAFGGTAPTAPSVPLAGAPALPATLPLTPTNALFSGDLLFILVEDPSRNLDPAGTDTVRVALNARGSGDTETLELYETGPGTGVFAGWIPVADDPLGTGFDGTLSSPPHGTVSATYIDPFDTADMVEALVLVDPFGRVFDSATGQLLDGVTVRLVDAITGAPAAVFGQDGVSAYPSTVVTGSGATDAGGQTYVFPPGEYLFPLVAPGTYRLEVTPGPDHVGPSTVPAPALQLLPGAPYQIVPGSRGDPFSIVAGPALEIDIPLDPRRALVLAKSASAEAADAGDFLSYTLRLTNSDAADAVNVEIADTLPFGLRYQHGSLAINGTRTGNPAIGPDGRTLTVSLALLPAGNTVEISYVAEVTGAARPGMAINRATAAADAGFRSNVATAAVRIRDDLFRSQAIIAGRVMIDACTPGDAWPREVVATEGLGGVRLYLEDGRHVTTDRDGLYHLENVGPGTHVLQLDTASLPDGYEVVFCEENSRFAGTPYSQFIDAAGGSVWRANFHVRRTARTPPSGADSRLAALMAKTGAAAPTASGAAPAAAPARSAGAKLHPALRPDWIEGQPATPEWVYPPDGETPAIPSLDLGIRHAAGDKVALTLNGTPVPRLNFVETVRARSSTAAISHWRGIDLVEGRNTVIAVVTGPDGTEKIRIERQVHYVTKAAQAHVLIDQSTLAADGRTAPELVVRITDRAGRPVHAGRLIEVAVLPPFAMQRDDDPLARIPRAPAQGASAARVAVGTDGLARIRLQPTLATGEATVRLTLDGGQKDLKAWIRPQARDWIVVGLAEGTLAHTTVRGNMTSLAALGGRQGMSADGRIAFFAKGMIKGEWLLTVALDSDKPRRKAERALFGEIDPNAYYTVYGDASEEGAEAESSYPLFLKLEREQFYALFGDYDTGLGATELARFERRLSGLKTAYEDENVSLVLFGAETRQRFLKDEIRANGTWGPFRLSERPIVRNSESVTVETRDRFRADTVVARQTLTRHIDYDIDYDTGEIRLRRPVPATDVQFNPNIIIASYESDGTGKSGLVYGGRAAVRLLDGWIEVGASYLHEDATANGAGRTSDLGGIDVTVNLAEGTQLRAEAARSRATGGGPASNGAAYLAEIAHVDADVAARAYARQEDAGFGLGQQTAATGGKRRVGAEASYILARRTDAEDTVLPGVTRIESQAYREEDLATGASRGVVEATLAQTGQGYALSLGLRSLAEGLAGGLDRRTTQLLASGEIALFERQLTLRAAHEQTVAGDESGDFPTRTLIGADWRIAPGVVLSASQEIRFGAEFETLNTSLGLTAEPWEGGRIFLGGDRAFGGAGTRLGARAGLGQTIALDENWSLSGGLERQQILERSGDAFALLDFAPDQPAESFTVAHAGVSFRNDDWTMSTRVEVRDGERERTYGLSGAIVGEVSEALTVSGLVNATYADRAGAPDTTRTDLRLGLAYRPLDEGPILLDRLDLVHEKDAAGIRQFKVVNNAALNLRLGRRLEAALSHGAKYVETDVLGATYSGFTHYAGGEVRFDLTRRIDLGAQAAALHSVNADTVDYSAGVSVGVQVFDNAWVSLGYNVLGFRDEDFAGAETRAEGPYVRFRLKLDQHSLGGLLDRFLGE